MYLPKGFVNYQMINSTTKPKESNSHRQIIKGTDNLYSPSVQFLMIGIDFILVRVE